jgi:hypothetical protein
MPKLAIIIVASATPAFYSQLAVISAALSKQNWTRWEPKIYAFLGQHDPDSGRLLQRWLPYLGRVEMLRVSEDAYRRQNNWAQCDAAIRQAPRDADVILALDADTLPVAPFEDLLDEVVQTDCVAGVMAHTPFPPAFDPPTEWASLATLIDKPLQFSHVHSLVGSAEPENWRAAPFYLNGGFVLHSRRAFDAFAINYLKLRRPVMELMAVGDFAGQAAITLAITDAGLPTLELPMRYNFPNDPRAETYQSAEMEHVIVHHYQHRGKFDRHKIFACAEEYEAFVNLDLSGINGRFQSDVITLFGRDYPFGPS